MKPGEPRISEAGIPGEFLPSLAASHPDRYPVLLESAAQGSLARYTILCAAPRAALWLDAAGKIGAFGVTPRDGGFFENLDAWTRATPKPAPPGGLLAQIPFRGGWIVYVGYEAAAEIERHLKLPPSKSPLTAFALRIEHFAVHELETGRVFAVSEGSDSAHDALLADLVSRARVSQPDGAPIAVEWIEEEAPELFLDRVRRVQEHIAAGDVYQANLSRAWRLHLRPGSTPADVYAALRRANPAPFAASVQFRGMTILSSSPERLLRIQGHDISTRPIAGTRPRLASRERDERVNAELVAHPKERAEHVMLIDLERNDLGRVCEAGSVSV
ncbi:MAG: chorismate-binding protein, partial [Steroidobacteraceae bacterium]|nr:chorismate-binding protein [Steroidobacteraceae bacterium]